MAAYDEVVQNLQATTATKRRKQTYKKHLIKRIQAEIQAATRRQTANGWPAATMQRVIKPNAHSTRGRSVRLVLLYGEQVTLPVYDTADRYGACLGEDGRLYWPNGALWFTTYKQPCVYTRVMFGSPSQGNHISFADVSELEQILKGLQSL